MTDPNGTATVAVNAADLSITQRRYLPFGALRGSQPSSWPDERGFVGGTVDPGTGLTHLGAREYDQRTGRFISVDPVTDGSEPQALNGYAYAGNSPISTADPDGLWWHPHIPKFVKNLVHKGRRFVSRAVHFGVSIVRHVANIARHVVRKVYRATRSYVHRVLRYGRSALHRLHRKMSSALRWTGRRVGSIVRRANSVTHRFVHKAAPVIRKAIELSRPGALRRLEAAGVAWAYGKAWNALKIVAPHIYIGVSGCFITFCLNATLQGHTLAVYGTGGPTGPYGNPFTSKNPVKLLKGIAKLYGGASIGYNTARFEDQGEMKVGVTAADGLLGANGGYGKRADGNGNYYFGGYSVGAGWAVQSGGKPIWSTTW